MSKEEKIELVRGSGNVFRDFNYANADVLQAKAHLAARIIGLLDDRGLSIRAAEKLTGFAAADFSRIRNVDLARFSLDRMIKIFISLDDEENEVYIDVRPRIQPEQRERAQTR